MTIGKLDTLFATHALALKLGSLRQQLLAANIANADTPHYKAVDIDFAAEMRRALTQTDSASALRTTHPRHLDGTGNPFGVRVLYRTDVQGNIDGNTVDMDRERAAFAENALRYEATLRMLGSTLQRIKTALRTQ